MRAWPVGLIGLRSSLLCAGLWSWGTYQPAVKGKTGPFQRPSERVQEAVLCTAWMLRLLLNLYHQKYDSDKTTTPNRGRFYQSYKSSTDNRIQCQQINPDHLVDKQGAVMSPHWWFIHIQGIMWARGRLDKVAKVSMHIIESHRSLFFSSYLPGKYTTNSRWTPFG